MNIDVMRFLDRFVGIPLCWMMGSYCRIVTKSSSRTKRQQVRNILVIKFFGMGSLILSTPALALTRRAFPEAHVTFLTFQKNRELVERISTIDAVLTIDHSSIAAFLRDTFSTIRSIIRIHPDITFDLEFFSKFSTLLSGFSQAPLRVAFALPTFWRSSIVTHQVPLEKNRHVVFSFCEQVLCIANERENIPPIEAPYVSEQDHASLLNKFPIEGRRLVAINVNAGDTFLERRWPADRFAQLVSALASEDDCVFCFTGSRGETSYVRSIIDETGCPERCIDTSGVLTVPELAALLERCDILISNDSGPLHLAASLGTPTVGLYGPESPDFYGVVQADSSVIYKKISCSPCMNIYSAKQFRCPYNAQCMRELGVDQVLQSVRSLVLVNG
jgi:ADP-heptose:LPS heptosyltransferase